MKHWFELTLQDEVLRKLKKEEYKKVMSWLRNIRRKMVNGALNEP